MYQYDFQRFLSSISDLGLPLMLKEASLEADSLENGIKWVDRQYKYKAEEYLRLLKGFVFFLREGIKPGGVSEEEFRSFRPAIEKIVDKGQFKPTILDLFE